MSETVSRGSALSIESLQKSFANESVIRGITLDIDDGEFCVIVGPSGSGKSTLLNCIAGLIEFDEGTISIDGRDISDVPTEDREIGFVFQDFEDRLFPHMSVWENVAFGLRQSDEQLSDAEIDRRITETLELLAIADLRDDRPSELSGGQQQRVELARQLVRRCDVMLLDDPLADLDYKLQKRMELEIRRIHESLDSTFVYVTHNQDQALKLADKLVVMNLGLIEQIGTPDEIYSNPATAFVGRFIGDSNAILGRVTAEADGQVVLDTDAGEIRSVPRDVVPEGETIMLIRPEAIVIGDEATERDNTLDVELVDYTFTGEHTEFAAVAEGVGELQIRMTGDVPMSAFDTGTRIGWDAADGVCYDRPSVAETVSIGDILEV